MTKVIDINGYQAVIQYDSDIEMFRGEFVGLNGGADFYAKEIDTLRHEGEISLKVFLEMCAEDGVNPRQAYSGDVNLHLPSDLYAQIATRATMEGKSVNQWVTDTLEQTIRTT